MKKKCFKKALIGLGIGTIIASGIILYFEKEKPIEPKDHLTWNEYVTLIETYNKKIEEIKNDCPNDKRCIEIGEAKRIHFEGIKNKKDIFDKLDKWIKEDIKNPKTYKLK